ncbi:phosphonate C-P lyase system protein PhnG [Natronorubrum sp. DTA7]|uniref:phosphonate C-P lyase system protein PhnG n=1 Tax=Natronorubrum sp. DTA7 TaxID=3447016 RepID=UPI003F868A65
MTAAQQTDMDRSARFEAIATCDEVTLVELADDVLEADPDLAVVQEPKPQLVMQRVVEPVESRPFNLGEVLVTAAEVRLDGAKGFAIVGGKAEHAALAGAVVDAAAAGDRPEAPAIERTLQEAVDARADDHARTWAESAETTVEFETMEDEP